MATTIDSMQAISRLTPLTEVLAMADLGIKPVAPRTIDVALAARREAAEKTHPPFRSADVRSAGQSPPS